MTRSSYRLRYAVAIVVTVALAALGAIQATGAAALGSRPTSWPGSASPAPRSGYSTACCRKLRLIQPMIER